jgi:hypothetical protein
VGKVVGVKIEVDEEWFAGARIGSRGVGGGPLPGTGMNGNGTAWGGSFFGGGFRFLLNMALKGRNEFLFDLADRRCSASIRGFNCFVVSGLALNFGAEAGDRHGS